MSNTERTSNRFLKKYPYLTMGVILVILSFGALCIAELYLKLANNNSANELGKQRYVELIEATPNSTVLVSEIESNTLIPANGEKTPHFKTDGNGFILPSFENETSDFSIVFMGDETIASLHLDSAKRFPYQVGMELHRKTNFRINCYNAGYPGNDIVHSINRLISVIVPLKPKMIVIMSSINDLLLLSRNTSYWEDAQHPKVKTFEFQDKSLFSLPKVRESIKKWNEKDLTETSQKLTIDTARIYSNYRSALKTFVNVCQDWHIFPILMSQPLQLNSPLYGETIQNKNALNLTQQEFVTIQQYMNLISKEVAAENGVRYIELSRKLNPEQENFIDFITLSEKGSEKAVSIVSDSISELVNRLHSNN